MKIAPRRRAVKILAVEIWKPINGYEGLYEVSNLGRVKSLARIHIMPNGAVMKHSEKILVAVDDGKGYLRLHLSKDGKVKSFRVHRLVAQAFIQNSNDFPTVNHIDGNKKNNVMDNLEWCTQAENIAHSYSTVLKTKNYPKAVKATDEFGNVHHFTSQCDAARRTGIAQQNISRCCLGKNKSAGGYVWQYIE